MRFIIIKNVQKSMQNQIFFVLGVAFCAAFKCRFAHCQHAQREFANSIMITKNKIKIK